MEEQTESSCEWFLTYLSVKETACMLGVSQRSVHGYITKGKLYGRRIDGLIRIEAEEVYAFKGTAPGRMRVSPPCWRVPPLKNLSYLTAITVRVQPGQGELLARRLDEFRAMQNHRLPGTAARSIVRSQHDPNEITILLTWRSQIMPSPDERTASLTALSDDLADVLDWATASVKEGQTLLHA